MNPLRRLASPLILVFAALTLPAAPAAHPDTSGWTPHYVDGGVHEGYMPPCLGPAWVPAARGAAR